MCVSPLNVSLLHVVPFTTPDDDFQAADEVEQEVQADSTDEEIVEDAGKYPGEFFRM